MGKNMWGYVTRTVRKPSDAKVEKYEELLSVWEMNNAKIITWINYSVEQSIGRQLAKFSTTKEIWDYLYIQSNFAKGYQLELELDIKKTPQGDRSIQDFNAVRTSFWGQLALTEPKELSVNIVYCNY